MLGGDLKTDLDFTSILWEDKFSTVLPSGNTKFIHNKVYIVSKFLIGHGLNPHFENIILTLGYKAKMVN